MYANTPLLTKVSTTNNPNKVSMKKGG